MILTRQPQYQARLNRSNQLGAKVIEHISLNRGVRGIVSNTVGTLGASGSYQAGPKGIGLRGSGASARASIAVNLSAYNKITMSFWLYWDAFANDDKLGFEFTANSSGDGSGGFCFDPNSGGAAGRIEVFGSLLTGTTFSNNFPRPTAAEWHRCTITFDSNVVQLYINGLLQSRAVGLAGTAGTAFTNSTLYLLSRNNTSLLGTGNLQDITIYNGVLTAAEAMAEYLNPYQIFQAPSRRRFAPPAAAGGGFFSRYYYDMGNQNA